MSRRVIAMHAAVLLTIASCGCGTLRQWVAPYQGLNSDDSYPEPGDGQYRQPAISEEYE